MDKLDLKATLFNWFRENNIHITPISIYYAYFEKIQNTKSINNGDITASRKWILLE